MTMNQKRTAHRTYRPLHTAGFTLVELLVVIAIIGVLAAILIPTFNGARKRSWDTAALQCGRAIISAEVAHRARTGGYYVGTPAGLNEDVAEACQGVQVQSYYAGFSPGPNVTGNNIINASTTNYNFWVWHPQGTTGYYTSTWDNLRLSVGTTW